MTNNNQWSLQIGDWVKGKSLHDELIHGYIEDLNLVQGTVRIHVTASDNEETIGKLIETPIHFIKGNLLVIDSYTEEETFALIDLALGTRDEAWFMELSTKLVEIRKGSSTNKKKSKPPFFRFKLGKSQTMD
jgi:hypothetical protein